jgi:hypothetical protein
MLRRTLIAVGAVALWAAAAPGQENLQPVVIDECESLETSKSFWEMTGVTCELSDEHASGGKHGLKLTFSKDGGAILFGSKDKPQDWSRYKSVGFDVYNPQDRMIDMTLRIDDVEAKGYKDRFEPSDDLFLPPGKSTHLEIDLTNIWANNVRLMDTSKITMFNVHLSKGAEERVLYVDSFRFIPLAEKDWPKKVEPAREPLVIDDARSAEKTARLWKDSAAKVETSAEGQNALKVTLRQASGSLRLSARDNPMDWTAYASLCFDVFNASDKEAKLTLRLDDVNTIDNNNRFTVEDIALPSGKTTPVQIDIWRPASRCGLKMDKSRITALTMHIDGPGEGCVLFFSKLRVDPSRGGVRNELRPGRIPGQTPATLGKALLDDPEIKPLVPIFKTLPPMRVAICAHSASISIHWSTSGAFFDIAAEAVKAVNPNVEYKGFHKGGMGAGAAVNEFLKNMIEYKPTDTYLLVVPSPMTAEQKLIDDMKAAGSRVFVFDAIKPWGAYSPKLTEELRKLCQDHGATFIELMARGWGAPGCPRWTTSDTIHMMTPGHIFYARELLKEWAKIYGPQAKETTQPAPAVK